MLSPDFLFILRKKLQSLPSQFLNTPALKDIRPVSFLQKKYLGQRTESYSRSMGYTKKNPRSYFSADLAFFTHKKEFGLSAIKGARDGIGRNGKRLEAFRGARESKSFLSP